MTTNTSTMTQATVKAFRAIARKHANELVRRASRWNEKFLCDLVEAYDALTPDALADAVLAHADHERTR